MSPEKQRAFFEDTTQWFADRYGIENIVNATVSHGRNNTTYSYRCRAHRKSTPGC